MIFVNGNKVEKDYFSNTEVRIKEFEIENWYNYVVLQYETENKEYKINDDLMILYFIKKQIDIYFRQEGREKAYVSLILKTMPYQRMDHKSGKYIHTLPFVADFIKSLNFEEIHVIEPHSSETKKYLGENAKMYYPVVSMLNNVIDNELAEIYGNVHIVFPDAGAYERYNESLDGKYDVCVFEKKREYDTNSIVSHEISKGHISRGSTCFILDDICSSGQTLLDVAYYAKMAGAKKIYIITAHCEALAFKSGLLNKNGPVTHMFTTSSMISCEHPKITYLGSKGFYKNNDIGSDNVIRCLDGEILSF